MILKALYDYYQRKLKLGEIAPLGFEDTPIQFVVVIDKDGKLFALEDQRSADGKDCRKYRLPRDVYATNNIEANLLWDNAGYVFGYLNENNINPKKLKSAKEKISKKFASFLGKVTVLTRTYPSNKKFELVKKFLESSENIESVKNTKEWILCKNIDSCNFTFKICGENELVASDSDVADFLKKTVYTPNDNGVKSICLISGEKTVPAAKHYGAKVGKYCARLVSFQSDSGYDSYNKKQGENAPVSPCAEFFYTSAFLDLWNRKTNRVLIGELRILFWSEKKYESQIEDNFGSLFGFQSKNDPTDGVSSISALYRSVFTGHQHISENNKFFVLGVEPNNSRMIVRFFICDTELVISERIAEHFGDFEIVGNSKIDGLFSIYNIVAAIHSGTDMKNVPANTEQVLISAILSGGMYPKSLQLQCLNRIRADRGINRIRAAILKAYLNRKNRILNRNEREIKMSLDVENTDIGYLCGRLFAVLERIQETALGKINATIVDRFYGSASSTPMSVFGKLIDLSNHHLSKIDKPNSVVFFRKAIGEIMDKMPASGFPSHLSLDEQSRFAIGYYHQKQEFFKSKTENNEIENKENEND